MQLPKISVPFLFLSPLLYSVDGDDYRAYEVVLVAFLSIFMLSRAGFNKLSIQITTVVATYACYLVVQQFFIARGDFLFGLKFLVATIMAFVPALVILNTQLSKEKLLKNLSLAISILYATSIVSIALLPIFGLGEVYYSGLLGIRSFGFLGDSFSPVLMLLFSYYFFEKSYLNFFISGFLVLMTGSKMVLVLLSIIFPIMIVLRSGNRTLSRIPIAFGFGITLPVLAYSVVSELALVEYTINTRFYSIRVGWDYFLSNPIFGIGINQTLQLAGDDAQFLARLMREDFIYKIDQVDNTYVRVLAETGVVGFILFALLMIVLLMRVWRIFRVAIRIPNSKARSFLLAATIFCMAQIIGFQTTAWFLSGHPQLAWLLIIFSFCVVVGDREGRSITAGRVSLR